MQVPKRGKAREIHTCTSLAVAQTLAKCLSLQCFWSQSVRLRGKHGRMTEPFHFPPLPFFFSFLLFFFFNSVRQLGQTPKGTSWPELCLRTPSFFTLYGSRPVLLHSLRFKLRDYRPAKSAVIKPLNDFDWNFLPQDDRGIMFQ